MKRIYIKEARPVDAAEYSQAMRRRKAAAMQTSEHYRSLSDRNQVTTVNRGAYIPEFYILNGVLYKDCLITAL